MILDFFKYSMSNDEYKTSLVNNNQYYFEYPKIHNNGYNDYPTVFSALRSDKNSIASFNNFRYKTDDVSHNAKCKDYLIKSQQLRPMNLITNNNTGLDLSHSIKKQFSSYCATESLPPTSNYNNSYASSPSSSTSPSIDVENDVDDNSSDRIMSPVSIPTHQQKSILTDSRSSSQNSLSTMELTAGSIPSGFPLNYQQLYANNAALYGAPVMFSGAIHAAHASYMAGLPLHSTLSPNDSYLKAIQAAACGIYSPTALAAAAPPPPTVNPSLISHKPPAIHNPSNSMMALAPSTNTLGIPKSPQHHQQYSPNMVNSRITEVEKQQQQQPKKDYLAPPPPTPSSLSTTTSATTKGLCTSANSSGTYLNDKVNERLTSVDAKKDSHFKVPNGKEGSLKHRILRPPSNSDCSSTETSKIPTMRAYSTTSNFKKGNYIELSNGALRRIEDMRTEDFIQCAERSPHHQLAESTVVKINTSLPFTAVITFSYDRNRSKVDMEVSLDHPFFVYGQGWASCNPEMSIKMFGLKCQRLQVGDICISLTKRESPVQTLSSLPATQTKNSTRPPQIDEALSYQRRHSIMESSPNSNLKSPSLPTMNAKPEVPYSPMNAHAFSIPVSQASHHQFQQQQQQLLQQQQQLHHQQQQHHIQQQQQQQAQQQAYAEMTKLMSSYAYAKGLPQLPHEQLKEVMLDAGMFQNLPPKMMNAFYQNQIFQFAQQEQLRQHDLKNSLQRTSLSSSSAVYNVSTHNNSQSPQPTDLENNQNQPPQTQPLDASISRKRRWSAPENMFDDDDETETQPPRKGSSPATARS